MRRIWALAALVAVLAGLLWVRHAGRAGSTRAAEGDSSRSNGAAVEPPAPKTAADPADAADADADELRRDYVIAGHAVDSAGRPVAEAKALLRQGCGDAFSGEDMEAVTDADGGFRFEGVYEGPCELSLGAPGFATAEIDVNAGDGSVDVVLRRAASVEVLVVDRDGRPVAAQLLWLSDRRSAFGNDYRFEEVDDSGRFRFERRNPGPLHLRAVTEDGREGEASVEVREGDEIRNVKIEVAAPWRSHLRLRPLVAKGSPRGVRFDCRDHETGERVRWEGDVATLLFRGPPGTSEPVCVRESGWDCEGPRSADRVLETAPLSDPAVIDILLPEPVLVRVETVPPVPKVQAEFSHFLDWSQKDGAWLLSPECSYGVTLSADGFLPVEIAGWRPPAAGGVLRAQLRAAGVVRGFVRDAHGMPVEGAKLQLDELDVFASGSGDATTDSHGRFSFATAKAGQLVLTASRKYRVFAATVVRVEPGRETDAGTLVPWTWRKVRGRVVDEARQPVGGAAVTFVAALAGDRPPALPCWSNDTYSRADGTYEIRAPAGDGFLLVRKRGYGATPVLPDHAEEIVLPRPALVRVEAPVDDRTFSIRWPDLVPHAIWRVGEYPPHTVAVAAGRIEVILDDERKQVCTLDAAQGATVEVRFER